jgi:hypothetical protein
MQCFADSRRMTVWGDLAELDYRPPQRDQILAYFERLVRHYVTLGFGSFRCDAAYKVLAEVWRALTGAGRAASPEVLFCAETLGAPYDAVLKPTTSRTWRISNRKCWARSSRIRGRLPPESAP